ncbi:MAG: Rid family detoxifying hydrolase [Planctomycetota bacterium]|jgi:2-iminobutanoate/2-iminopropanoate deaminase|nr:reactive intermediate/imine deaminase [Planctomycetota bacterium]MDP6409417.1 Rid family detoxifying hydrolase [Planctomycetota bacterium]MDP6540859.1 Rid family detoxifying hydrolase [Planctomycetota bacterium]
MSDRRAVHTPDAPDALGPYSQAVVACGLVHCSGQIGLDPASGEFVEGDVTAQAERVLANLCAVLEAAGSGIECVLKCNVYLADLADFAAVNEVYARTFEGDAPPARACIEARLPKGALIEIDCVALAR